MVKQFIKRFYLQNEKEITQLRVSRNAQIFADRRDLRRIHDTSGAQKRTTDISEGVLQARIALQFAHSHTLEISTRIDAISL